MPESLRDHLQRTLGDGYVLERELTAGGMSRVFVVTDRTLGRKVVVKVLPPDFAIDISIERFRREIRVAAQLQHPHIVPLHPAGDATGGLLYYIMPFVEGDSLRALLARSGPRPVAEVIRILRDVASALARSRPAPVGALSGVRPLTTAPALRRCSVSATKRFDSCTNRLHGARSRPSTIVRIASRTSRRCAAMRRSIMWCAQD